MFDTKLKKKTFLTFKIISNELHKTTNKNSNLNSQRQASPLLGLTKQSWKTAVEILLGGFNYKLRDQPFMGKLFGRVVHFLSLMARNISTFLMFAEINTS